MNDLYLSFDVFVLPFIVSALAAFLSKGSYPVYVKSTVIFGVSILLAFVLELAKGGFSFEGLLGTLAFSFIAAQTMYGKLLLKVTEALEQMGIKDKPKVEQV